MTIPMINVEGGVPLVSETYFEFLQENGFDAIRLKEEVLAWKQKGLPVN